MGMKIRAATRENSEDVPQKKKKKKKMLIELP